jgi:hypothetical protein
MVEVKQVALGGLVVSVLAARHKVRWFKPGRGRWILRVIKSAARHKADTGKEEEEEEENPQRAFLRRGSKAVGPMS